MSWIETDYLVVGAGASGMAFTDALISESDAEVVMVDRRHRPGGHWHEAYPFVRLHQPSAFYGINARRLGRDAIDRTGENAGFYERATAVEICDYYRLALEENVLPSGQVRFLGMHEYQGEGPDGHRCRSRLTGQERVVRVRRKVVDATYVEPSVPATHTPSFPVDPAVRLVPPNALVDVAEPADGFTVIGAGKTAMDTCGWLLDNGVSPDRIRWIRPRDPWVLDRGWLQPLTLVANVIDGLSRDLEAAANADSVDDLFCRLESAGRLHRLDPDVVPTMYRGAILSRAERERLRTIEGVVRRGRVTAIGSDRIVLERGSVATDRRQVHVDCSAIGLPPVRSRPIFEPRRITLQSIRTGQTPLNAALAGFVEASRDEDEDKNRLCPPNPYPSRATDWIRTTATMVEADARWSREPDLREWLDRSRLNVAAGARDHLDDPRMQAARARLGDNLEQGISNLWRLHSEVDGHPAPTP